MTTNLAAHSSVGWKSKQESQLQGSPTRVSQGSNQDTVMVNSHLEHRIIF